MAQMIWPGLQFFELLEPSLIIHAYLESNKPTILWRTESSEPGQVPGCISTSFSVSESLSLTCSPFFRKRKRRWLLELTCKLVTPRIQELPIELALIYDGY